MIPAVERFEIAFKRRRRYHRLTAEGGITFDIKIGFHERRCLLEALIVEQDRDRVNESSYVRKTKLSKSSLLQLQYAGRTGLPSSSFSAITATNLFWVAVP